MKDVKITIIGAGSGFGRAMLADMMSNEKLTQHNVTIALVDTDPQALDVIADVGAVIQKHYKTSFALEKYVDRTDALPGTDFVVSAVEVDRMRLWEQDFRVPLAYGFKHVLGENGGPGAMFHALRNYRIVLPICEDIEELAPDAIVMNFSNPESRIMMAMSHLTNLKAVGLCHGVLEGREYAARLLGRDEEELEMITGGLNHFYWFLKVQDKATGEDLYPSLKEKVAQEGSAFVRTFLEIFDYVIFPSDNHIGEYLGWAHEFCDGLLFKYGIEGGSIDNQYYTGNWREKYLAGEISIEALVAPSCEVAVDMLADIADGNRAWYATVNVQNDDLYIENLPREAVVEVPATVDADGIHPEKIGPLPEMLAAFCRVQVSIQLKIIEAYQKRSKKLLLQALLMDPVVDSVAKARKMMEYMFEIQKDYLPVFGE